MVGIKVVGRVFPVVSLALQVLGGYVGLLEFWPGTGRRGSGPVGYAAVGQDHAGAVGVDGSEAGDVAFADEEVVFGGLDGQHGLGIRRGGAGVPGGVGR